MLDALRRVAEKYRPSLRSRDAASMPPMRTLRATVAAIVTAALVALSAPAQARSILVGDPAGDAAGPRPGLDITSVDFQGTTAAGSLWDTHGSFQGTFVALPGSGETGSLTVSATF